MNRVLFYLLVLFIVLDAGFSFVQHLHKPHDGDMAAIIVPSEWYQQVLDDPYGITAATRGVKYAGTNRGIAHWSLSAYFKTVPQLLQHFVSPVRSTYLASALAKIVVQLALVWLLSVYITATGYLKRHDGLLAAALLVPLFQTAGYYDYMGVIDRSIGYTFFYPLPFVFLLLFFLPFYRAFINHRKPDLNIVQKVLLLLAAFLLPFQGPLVPAVVLLVCPAVLLWCWWRGYRAHAGKALLHRAWSAFRDVPHAVLFFFSLLTLLSLYSMYIGRFNAENDANMISLAERYARLPKGLFVQLTSKLGYPMLIVMLLLNAWLLERHGREGHRLLRLLKWMSIFGAVYLLLLPLGGYRNYRPLIIRRDTFLPVTFCMFYFFGLSTLYVLRHVHLRQRGLYIAAVVLMLAVFTVADRTVADEAYSCEKDALRKIAAATGPEVKLDNECSILAWETIRDPGSSEVNARLLQIWGVTTEKRLYYTGP